MTRCGAEIECIRIRTVNGSRIGTFRNLCEGREGYGTCIMDTIPTGGTGNSHESRVGQDFDRDITGALPQIGEATVKSSERRQWQTACDNANRMMSPNQPSKG